MTNEKALNPNLSNLCVGIGAICAMLAVSAGAFGAHALKSILSPYSLNVYHTAVDYQFIHAIGLILIGILNNQTPSSVHKTVALLLFIGIILFSGSLYLLSFTGIKWLGMITPIGGLCFIVAWFSLGISYLKNSD